MVKRQTRSLCTPPQRPGQPNRLTLILLRTLSQVRQFILAINDANH